MKRLELKKLSLRNFKGITALEISFGNVTNIKGANATGKTTIMDAFKWLLFDKDSFDRKDFNIKTLDPLTGEAHHRLEHEVIAELLFNGDPIVLKKIYREKWVKPRGKTEEVFSGHETSYYWNDVPLSQKDYNAKISELCEDENVFKILTDPLVFPKLPWQNQRSLAFGLAPTIKDEDIASLKPDFQLLLKSVNGYKSIEEYKKMISSKKSKIKDELDHIPARIEEAQRAIPQPEDYDAIEKLINDKTEAIKTIDKEISDLSSGMEAAFQEYRTRQGEVNKKKSKLQEIEFSIQKEASRLYLTLFNAETEKKGKVKNLQSELDRHYYLIKGHERDKERLENQRNTLRDQWHTINNEQLYFNDEDFKCPACNRYFEDADIDAKKTELSARFNEFKAARLALNVAKGKELTKELDSFSYSIIESQKKIKETEEVIKTIEAEIEAGKEELKKAFADTQNWQSLLPGSLDHQRLLREITNLEEAIGAEPKRVNITDQTTRKEALQNELKELNQRLGKRQLVTPALSRIEELKGQQKKLSQELADLEKIEYNIQEFTKAKIDAIETQVNSKFNLVKFRMFNRQINGGEVETCECLIDGVPYSDLNHASKINAGMDIISTLADHYEFYAPVFIDNRESVNNLEPVKSQLVNLIVTNDPQLVINQF